MSTIPGYTLEKFLMWNYNLIVDDEDSANLSLQIAEALGNVARRPQITSLQFAPLVALFESVRESIEYWLNDYDEDTQSWRDYGSYPPCDDGLLDEGSALVKVILADVSPPGPTPAV